MAGPISVNLQQFGWFAELKERPSSSASKTKVLPQHSSKVFETGCQFTESNSL